MITKEFLKDVVADEKKLLHNDDAKAVKVPMYDELSIKKLYEPALQKPGMADYFPD